MLKVIRRPAGVRSISLLALAAMLASTAPSAYAQDSAAETRLRKVEAEVRALQRKVFPGGDDRFFKPEIASPATGTTSAPAPSTSAVTDLLSRMDALESQLARLTGQIEENANRIRTLEDRAGVSSSSGTAVVQPVAPSPSAPGTSQTALATVSAPQSNLNAMTGGAAANNPVATAPESSRVAAVRAIEKPQTDDPADDEYSYGFRLWDANFYPESQQQLQIFIDKYPNHKRASWGRNLLGRAYLDDGKPREAAKWFLQNYQKDKSGGRASDSLLYLAVAMKQLKDNKRACIALAEFSETYAAEAAGRLKELYDSTRRGLAC